MSEQQIDGIDFAVAAYREEGVWQVVELAHNVLTDIDHLAAALRRFPGDGGAMGLVAIDEDFFLIVRVTGQDAAVWNAAMHNTCHGHCSKPLEDIWN
jgi:putative tRNA adenosine deaminase-associated protein